MTEKDIPQHQLLQLADTCLLWGHRLSEWCGHGPALEEDIALTNTALDVIGQARTLYQIVSQRKNEFGVKDVNGVTEDTLAFFREPDEFQNVRLAELPNGDYAHTIVRSFFLAAWFAPVWEQLADSGADPDVCALAREAHKAARAQWRHASEWVVRFGDGTIESKTRVEAAINELLPYAHELLSLHLDHVDMKSTEQRWQQMIAEALTRATLPPLTAPLPTPRMDQLHRRHRVELLSEMQSLARQHPNAVW